jgi:hypothetical protein
MRQQFNLSTHTQPHLFSEIVFKISVNTDEHDAAEIHIQFITNVSY